MADFHDLERIIAEQIKTLQLIAKCELKKREAIAKANLDLAQEEQENSDNLFDHLASLDLHFKAEEKKMKAIKLSSRQIERLQKLKNKRREEAEEANKLNRQNQKILEDIIREMQNQLNHIKKGKRALSGYQTVNRSKKDPKIISGEF